MIINLPEGSSGHGFSYWDKLMGCRRQAELSTNHEIVKAVGGLDGQAVGILMHAMLEEYDNGRLGTDDVEAIRFPQHWAATPINVIEAKRLMSWWVLNYEPEHFGKTFCTEQYMENDPKLTELFGIPEGRRLTARLDLMVDVSEADIERLARTRGLILPWPGLYIVDHKWYKSRTGFTNVLNGMQSLGYPFVAQRWLELNKPERADDFHGIIFHFGIKTKKPDSIAFLRKPDWEEDLLILRSFFTEALERESRGNKTNPTLCYPFAQNACPFAPDENGYCRRY
jgi:hypothetical protein